MIVGENTLNINQVSNDAWCVVDRSGTTLSEPIPRNEVHALCLALCVQDHKLYPGYIKILDEDSVDDGWGVWLSFDDGMYRAELIGYVPQWYEIYVGSVREVDKWLGFLKNNE